MGPFEAACIFGGLVYWPIYMLFHRRWSLKAKLLLAIFLGTIGAAGTLGALFLALAKKGVGIEATWPLQVGFPIITVASLLASFTITVVFDDKGNI
jgi:hypothetical protein